MLMDVGRSVNPLGTADMHEHHVGRNLRLRDRRGCLNASGALRPRVLGPGSPGGTFGAGKDPSLCSGELIAPVRGVTIHAARTYTIPGYTSVAVRYPDVGLLGLAADATKVAGGRILPRATAGDLAYWARRAARGHPQRRGRRRLIPRSQEP
jgi:hypothetical protein